MRSLADPRRAAEWLLRAALVLALGASLWRALRPHEPLTATRRTDTAALMRALAEATRTPSLTALDVEMREAPTPVQRAWLVALRRAGVAVRWHGDVSSLALEALPVREPRGGYRLLLAADSGRHVVLSDAAGVIDSVRMAGAGALVETGGISNGVTATDGAWAARSAIPSAVEQRAVLVLGRAGWESRFVATALEESGWLVRSRAPAAPGVVVATAALLPLDSSRYDVVIALDSTAGDLAAAIARFVAHGGGLVAAGSATDLAGLRAIVPARAGARRPGRILLGSDVVRPADLPVRPLGSFADDAVRAERASGVVVVAARRAGRGRAVSVGYDESWRWRMLGGVPGPDAHRAWWSAVVGSASPERTPDVASAGQAQAPLAALVEALGPPSPRGSDRATPDADGPLPRILLIAIVLALLAETASRRFRGAR